MLHSRRRHVPRAVRHAAAVTLVVALAAALATLAAHDGRAAPASWTAAPAIGRDDDGPSPDSLARLVIAGGESGRAALRAAIAASGLGVRAGGGRAPVHPARPAQGIWFDQLELAAMERGMERGSMTTLGDVARVLARGEPAFGEVPLASTLLADLERDTRSDVPTRMFFARFVLALGGWHGDAAAADGTPLDAVQLAFITRRLHADLALAMPGGVPRRSGMRPSPGSERRVGQRVARTSFASRGGPRAGDELPMAGPPRAACTLSDTEATLLDYAAAGYGVGFGKVADLVGGKVASYAKMAGVASVLASYAKLGLMFTFMKATWEDEGGPVLVRTKSETAPGARKTLTVQLRYDIDDLQLVNCVRLAFNHVGFDFSMPNGGPIGDAEVDFALMEGGTSAQHDMMWRSKGFEPGYVEMTGRPLGVPTDDAGRARLVVQGMKQREPIAASARPFDRPASVQARVRLTTPDLVKEAPALAGAAMSGGLTVLATMIPELVTRGTVPLSSHRFTVRDWAAGYQVTAVARNFLLGSDAEDACGGLPHDGVDRVDGFFPIKNGRFVATSTSFERRTSAPICAGKPVQEWVDWGDGRRRLEWTGIECSMRLVGRQLLEGRIQDTHDPETDGPATELLFRRRAGQASAQVNGDCPRSRFGGGYPPDHEFAGESREDQRRAYMGLPAEGAGGGVSAEYASLRFVVPASATKGGGEAIVVEQTLNGLDWRIELRVVGMD